MSKAFSPNAEGVQVSGVRGRDIPEELVEVSQPFPEEHREEMSPSRACGSREEDLDDLPEEPPREEPPREEQAAPELTCLPRGSNLPMPPRLAGRGRGGDVVAGGAAPLLNDGEVLTEPSRCCTRSQTSLHFKPPPGRFGATAAPG